MSDPSARPVLMAQGVTAGYGGGAMISAVDLTVQAGDFLGLLGANGAGKSTLLRAITGQIRLMAGEVRIAGADLATAPAQAKSRFGYAVDAAELPLSVTARQYFGMVGSIRHCAASDWPVADLPEQFGIMRWLDQPLAACSLGTRAKIAIAAALLGSPPLIILDESLNGLDPVSSWRIKTILRGLLQTGRHAVVLSTHMLETVAALCNRAVFLQDGAITHHWDAAAMAAARAVPGGFEAVVIAALNSK